MFSIEFQVKWSQVKVKLVIFIRNVVYLISFDPLLDGYQTRYTSWFWREDYPYCFLGHKVKKNYWSSYQHCLFNEPLIYAWQLPNLVQWLPPESGYFIVCMQIFWILHQRAFMFLKLVHFYFTNSVLLVLVF